MVVEAKVNRGNRRDVEQLQDLSARAHEGTLKEVGKKKLVRLQVRLAKEGVIVPYNRDHVRAAMVDTYKSFPWWKKALLRWRYHKKLTIAWVRRQWVRLQMWWVSR